jgi:hypothetical protein
VEVKCEQADGDAGEAKCQRAMGCDTEAPIAEPTRHIPGASIIDASSTMVQFHLLGWPLVAKTTNCKPKI